MQPTLVESFRLLIGQRDQQGRLVQDLEKLVPRCPEAIERGLQGCCPIRRAGKYTRHGVYAQDFPIALEKVQRFECTRHSKHFSFLSPAVWKNLPEDAEVHPNICVLTERTILMADLYDSLVHQAVTRPEFKSLAKELVAVYTRNSVRRLETYGEYMRAVGGEDAQHALASLAADIASSAARRINLSSIVVGGGRGERASSCGTGEGSAVGPADWLAQDGALENNPISADWRVVIDTESEDYMLDVPLERLQEDEPDGDAPEPRGLPGRLAPTTGCGSPVLPVPLCFLR